MGLRAIIARVYDQVPRATLATDATATFVAADDGNGRAVRIEDLVKQGAVQDRAFDVRGTGLPRDDGVATATSANLRLRATLVVRIYYWLGEQSRTWLEQQMDEDCAALYARLANPSNWDSATTLTDAWVFERTQPTAAPIGDPDDRGEPRAFLLSFPFEVIYRESA